MQQGNALSLRMSRAQQEAPDRRQRLRKIAETLASEFNLKKLDATSVKRILDRAQSLRGTGLGTLPRPPREGKNFKKSNLLFLLGKPSLVPAL
jgi:hypothetical protein